MLSFGVWGRPSPRNTLGTVLGCSDDEVSGSGRCGGATVVLCVGVVRACTCDLCRTDRQTDRLAACNCMGMNALQRGGVIGARCHHTAMLLWVSVLCLTHCCSLCGPSVMEWGSAVRLTPASCDAGAGSMCPHTPAAEQVLPCPSCQLSSPLRATDPYHTTLPLSTLCLTHPVVHTDVLHECRDLTQTQLNALRHVELGF
jgi:hypothetical protein